MSKLSSAKLGTLFIHSPSRMASAAAPAAGVSPGPASRRARSRALSASSSPRGGRDVSSRAVASFFPFAPPSGDLLSGAASFALRSYLVECGSVDVAVDANAGTLLAGTVSRVDITGTNWRSRKDLTCRSLRMSVGEAVLDPGALVAERLIKLRRPSRGDAEIVFTDADFANFLAHPLVTAAASERGATVSGRALRFARDSNPRAETTTDGAVAFFGDVSDANAASAKSARVRYEMRPVGERGKVAVIATRVTDTIESHTALFRKPRRRLVRRAAFVSEHARQPRGRHAGPGPRGGGVPAAIQPGDDLDFSARGEETRSYTYSCTRTLS
jgi:hypothetical protein